MLKTSKGMTRSEVEKIVEQGTRVAHELQKHYDDGEGILYNLPYVFSGYALGTVFRAENGLPTLAESCMENIRDLAVLQRSVHLTEWTRKLFEKEINYLAQLSLVPERLQN